MKQADQDLWENDPSLVPMTPEREKQINDMTFAFVNKRNLSPQKAFPKDKAMQGKYQAWLDAKKA